MEPVEVAHRLWDPVQQYAMIDNALAGGRGPYPGRAPVGGGRAVGPLQPGGPHQSRTPPSPLRWTPISIATPSPSNRPWPSRTTSGTRPSGRSTRPPPLLFCSVEAAARARGAHRPVGVPPGRAGVEPRRLVAAPHGPPHLAGHGGARDGRRRRGSGVRWPRPRSSRLYSCFPAAVRVQQRMLGLDRSTTPTVTGGMAFAGGPFNNFVLQSMVPVIRRLRAEPGALAVVTTVSGLLTKPGIGVWSATPRRPTPAGRTISAPRPQRPPGRSTWSRRSTATTGRPRWPPTR